MKPRLNIDAVRKSMSGNKHLEHIEALLMEQQHRILNLLMPYVKHRGDCEKKCICGLEEVVKEATKND